MHQGLGNQVREKPSIRLGGSDKPSLKKERGNRGRLAKAILPVEGETALGGLEHLLLVLLS